MGRAAAVPAAESRLRLRSADLATDFAAIKLVRETVFVHEQKIAAELEFDDRDAACVHLLAFDGDAAIGTARLDVDGKIGRVAVLASHRRRGVASALMERLHEIARERGLAGVWCNAQRSAVPLYEHLGYTISSAPFDEAGIEHVRMQRGL
jgi:predicted GNAT family N-acyltransferase